MDVPRIGISLPQFGPHAGPEGVATVARAADRLGFHAVSVTDRLLTPVRPDWANDAGLPEAHVWDPIELLTWAAAHTERVRLVTGVVNSIFQQPAVLARRLATLDRLSGGRLDAGIGQGGGTREPPYCLVEEFTAAGVPVRRRGAGFAEHVAAMRACWRADPVEFDGEYYRIPRSAVGPKPCAGTIPLLFGATTQHTIERAARLGDGFVTVALPGGWADTRTRIGWYRDAGGTGTVVVNAIQVYPDGEVTPELFTGAVLADLDDAAAAGADEMHVTLNLAGVAPGRQAELLAGLAARLDLPDSALTRHR